MRFALLLLALIFPRIVGATLTLVDYSKYNPTIDTTDKNNIKIFSGSTGTSCSGDGTTTCDSCATLGTMGATPACNSRQVYNNLVFSVVIRSDNEKLFTGTNNIFVYNSNTNGQITANLDRTFDSTAVNQNIRVSFTWSGICGSATGTSTSCATSFSNKIIVGIGSSVSSLTESTAFTFNHRYVASSDEQKACGDAALNPWEAFCGYTVYPGDEKVHIRTSVVGNNAFKVGNLVGGSTAGEGDASGMYYSHMRVYYATGNDFSVIVPSSSQYKDIPFLGGNLIDARVTGLTNGEQYVFTTASVDQGGNVTYFTGTALIATLSNLTTPPYGTTQSAIPREVYGLLDDEKCFISTAAFGSPMAKEVMTFRQFRDGILLHSDLGIWLTKAYYEYSPPVAKIIAQSETLRMFTRTLLWPLLAFSVLALKLGFLKAFALTLLMVASLSTSMWFWRRRRKGVRI